MPYDLFVTGTSGATRKALRSPYPSRLDTCRTVKTVVEVEGSDPKAREFANRVAEAPLGETVVHEATGIAFRTEEHTA